MTKHSMQMCGVSPFSSYKATIKQQSNINAESLQAEPAAQLQKEKKEEK